MQKKNVRAVGPILSLTKTDAAPIAAIVFLLTIQNGGFSNNTKKPEENSSGLLKRRRPDLNRWILVLQTPEKNLGTL